VLNRRSFHDGADNVSFLSLLFLLAEAFATLYCHQIP